MSDVNLHSVWPAVGNPSASTVGYEDFPPKPQRLTDTPERCTARERLGLMGSSHRRSS
jgi:hypothetical protein